jgi:hypothetical protein
MAKAAIGLSGDERPLWGKAGVKMIYLGTAKQTPSSKWDICSQSLYPPHKGGPFDSWITWMNQVMTGMRHFASAMLKDETQP